MEPGFAQIIPRGESEAAEDDEQHNRDVDHRLRDIGAQGRIGTTAAHEIETAVAESGDGMKKAVPDTSREAEIPDENGGHGGGAEKLQERGGFQDEAGQPDNSAHLCCGDGFPHGAALSETDAFAGKKKDCKGSGDNAHPADLNQHQENRLTEE